MQKALLASVAFFALFISGNTVRSEEKALGVGDAAPTLAPGKWIKGEPVGKFEKGKIYVVEFWATWCGPCRASIPHLSKLQEQYKDVTFIGQDCWEEDQAHVPGFVEKMGDKMNYRVALDDVAANKTGVMATNWMLAAKQEGIPTAFVVDKETRIAWIGHPMQLDDVIKGIVAGTFDAKKLAAEEKAREQLRQTVVDAIQKKDYDAALAGIDKWTAAQPEMAKQLSSTRFELLLRKGDNAGASVVGKQLLESFKDDSGALNNIAWMMIDPNGFVKNSDLDLAEKMASRASELSKGEKATYLDTLARVYFLKGQLDKAVETETKALEKAPEAEKLAIKQDLEQYKAALKKTQK